MCLWILTSQRYVVKSSHYQLRTVDKLKLFPHKDVSTAFGLLSALHWITVIPSIHPFKPCSITKMVHSEAAGVLVQNKIKITPHHTIHSFRLASGTGKKQTYFILHKFVHNSGSVRVLLLWSLSFCWVLIAVRVYECSGFIWFWMSFYCILKCCFNVVSSTDCKQRWMSPLWLHPLVSEAHPRHLGRVKLRPLTSSDLKYGQRGGACMEL